MSEFKFDNKNEIFLEIEDLSRKQEEQQKRIDELNEEIRQIYAEN